MTAPDNPPEAEGQSSARLSGFSYGRMRSVEHIHLTGGLRARRLTGGWGVGPLGRSDGGRGEIATVPDRQLQAVAAQLGLRVFGVDETILGEPSLPMRIWRPLVGMGSRSLPTETWSSIGHNASRAGDEEYAQLARYISICLVASDIRLRDLSDGYGSQFDAALERRQTVGHRWDNIATADLRLAVHSLVSEIASARDHLARIVGLHVGAPPSKNSLVWLLDWIGAASRRHLLSDPRIAVLRAGWVETSPDRWLHELSEYRNVFLHREPLGARGMEGALSLEIRPTPFGDVPRLQMPLPGDEGGPAVDALERFVELHRKMTLMAADLADLARYPATLPVITSADLAAPGA